MTPIEKLILSRIKVLNIIKGMLWFQTKLKSLGENAANIKEIAVH
jgi:hypothetical protein